MPEQISDKKFVGNFVEFNLEYKKKIAEYLLEHSNKENITQDEIKFLTIQMFELYISITEIIVMLLYSIKRKNENNKSLLYNYQSINIKEGVNSKFSTEEIFSKIFEMDIEEFNSYFNLPDFDTMYSTLNSNEKNKFHELFGSIEDAKKEYNKERDMLKTSLGKAVQVRIKDKNGNLLPFNRIHNKIKHGLQFVNDINDEFITFLISVNSESNNSSICNTFSLAGSKKNINTFKEQLDIMIDLIKHLFKLIMYKERIQV